MVVQKSPSHPLMRVNEGFRWQHSPETRIWKSIEPYYILGQIPVDRPLACAREGEMEFASSVREFPTWQTLEMVSWETPSNFQPSPVHLEKMVWPQAGRWKLPVSAEFSLASGNWRSPFPPHGRRRKNPSNETRIYRQKSLTFGGRNFQFPGSDAGLRASLEAGKLS